MSTPLEIARTTVGTARAALAANPSDTTTAALRVAYAALSAICAARPSEYAARKK